LGLSLQVLSLPASVGNIDWPTRPGLSVEQNKADLLRLLDAFAQQNLNAVFLQIRPEADALYQSSLEPWSRFLTNTQGEAPHPFWDPLAFAIDEAHKRSLQLHAWLNP